MRPIELDFVPQARLSGAAWALLAFGIVVAALVLFWDQSVLQPEVDQLEARVQNAHKSMHKAMPENSPAIDKQLSADLARALSVSAELNLPWDRLFAAIEGSADHNVTLLTLEPDAIKHALSLTAEARNFRAMLEFYRKLETQPNLRDVNLHTHQTNEQDEERPIRFRITCTWLDVS